MEIYLDNSATTKQYDEVTSFMADIARTAYGNPSSLHSKGIEAERLVKSARETIAASLGAEEGEIYFTSGGTESNNLAIRGYLDANPRAGRHIITTKIEHPSVLEVYKHLESLGYRVDYISVDSSGFLDLSELKRAINPETALISIIYINNETGIVQNFGEISAIRDTINPGTVIHADAVQAYGKIPLNPSKMGIGLMSMSSHKIHGPKGVGALFSSKKLRLKPIFFGGGQEAFIRSGTENVPGIAGFGLASKLIFEKLEKNYEKAAVLKKRFIGLMDESDIEYRIISPPDSSPYILNAAFDDIRAEVLLHHLEQKGIFVSTGSACSSHKKNKSHVLTAIGIEPGLIDGAIRFSFSGFNTEEQIDITVRALHEIIPIIKIHKKQKLRRSR